MKDYTTYGAPLTQEVAQRLIAACDAAPGIGPRCEQLDRVASPDQMRELRALWFRLPGHFSLWGTLLALANGEIDDYLPSPPAAPV